MIYADPRDERDAEVAIAIRGFDDELTLPATQHDTFSKAQRAMQQHLATCDFESRVHDAGTIMLHGAKYVARGDGCPDKPGTVRAPGIRRQFGSGRKQRWSGQ